MTLILLFACFHILVLYAAYVLVRARAAISSALAAPGQALNALPPALAAPRTAMLEEWSKRQFPGYPSKCQTNAFGCFMVLSGLTKMSNRCPGGAEISKTCPKKVRRHFSDICWTSEQHFKGLQCLVDAKRALKGGLDSLNGCFPGCAGLRPPCTRTSGFSLEN